MRVKWAFPLKSGEGRWLRRKPPMDADLHGTSADPQSMAGNGGGPTLAAERATPIDLKRRIGATAFAFRGYDVANIGRGRELLEHALYGPVVRRALENASEVCADAIGEAVDLVAHVEAAATTAELATFPHDVATIVALECVQLQLLEEFFDVPIHRARLSFGYSIGELTALIFGGAFTMEQLLPIPLGLCRDCAELAADTNMGVLFTRGPALAMDDVERLCQAVSSEGKGLIGPSAYLSPNTALLLGQGRTLDALERRIPEFLAGKVMLRRNPNHWPPLHSPLVWQRLIPNRTAMALYRVGGGAQSPSPPVYSCVTGDASYEPANYRERLTAWTDHPQRLWDVIDATLTSGVEVVIHVGPAPNLIPATFARLSNNVSRHLGNKYLHLLGRGVVDSMNRHAWLARLLPSRTALLRAPYLVNVILEDWLLDQPAPQRKAVAFSGIAEGGGLDHSDTMSPALSATEPSPLVQGTPE